MASWCRDQFDDPLRHGRWPCRGRWPGRRRAGQQQLSDLGVVVAIDSLITAGGAGTVTVCGAGGQGSGGDNDGVRVDGDLGTWSTISANGNIFLCARPAKAPAVWPCGWPTVVSSAPRPSCGSWRRARCGKSAGKIEADTLGIAGTADESAGAVRTTRTPWRSSATGNVAFHDVDGLTMGRWARPAMAAVAMVQFPLTAGITAGGKCCSRPGIRLHPCGQSDHRGRHGRHGTQRDEHGHGHAGSGRRRVDPGRRGLSFRIPRSPSTSSTPRMPRPASAGP